MRLENSIEESDYLIPRLSKPKWIFILLLTLIGGFFLNFSFFERIEGMIKLNLNKNQNCPINYSEAKFELFFPKVILNNISMPGRCVSSKNPQKIELKRLTLNLIGPSFSPLGINLLLNTNLAKSQIISKQTLGFSTQTINTKGTVLDLESLVSMTGLIFQMQGQVETNALIQIQNSKIINSKFLLKSKNLFLPSQKLEGFEIPNLNLKNFSLKGTYERSGKLHVDDLIIGDKNAPLYANFKGDITINNQLIGESRLDLKGEVIFSNEFLESFPILKLFLAQFTQKDNYYQIKLGGTLRSPVPIQ